MALTNPSKHRPFRFIVAWLKHEQFVEFLKCNWRKEANMMVNLDNFKEKLHDWNFNIFGHVGRKKREIIARPGEIDCALERRYSQFLVNLEKELKRELDVVLAYEESIWFQKSCSKWIVDGEKMLDFFTCVLLIGGGGIQSLQTIKWGMV